MVHLKEFPLISVYNFTERSLEEAKKTIELIYGLGIEISIDITGCENMPYEHIVFIFGKLYKEYGNEFKKSLQFTCEQNEMYLLNKFKSVF